MNSPWQRYRRLSQSERRDLLRGFALIPTAAIFVRVCGAERWRRLTELRGRTDAESENEGIAKLKEARRTARMIEAAARHGAVRGNCLSKSVALWWLLRRKGIRAQLRIGARKAGRGFEAHAWVEMGDEIINDTEEVRESYATFETPMTRRAATGK